MAMAWALWAPDSAAGGGADGTASPSSNASSARPVSRMRRVETAVWVAGSNEHGQLGLGASAAAEQEEGQGGGPGVEEAWRAAGIGWVAEPRQLNTAEIVGGGADTVVEVHCAENQTTLLTAAGQLFTCGENERGNLGLPLSVVEDGEPCFEFERVEFQCTNCGDVTHTARNCPEAPNYSARQRQQARTLQKRTRAVASALRALQSVLGDTAPVSLQTAGRRGGGARGGQPAAAAEGQRTVWVGGLPRASVVGAEGGGDTNRLSDELMEQLRAFGEVASASVRIKGGGGGGGGTAGKTSWALVTFRGARPCPPQPPCQPFPPGCFAACCGGLAGRSKPQTCGLELRPPGCGRRPQMCAADC
eukprot:COSAG01_NODE_4831_length_4703_cov_184.304301_3_plen_361_part_00